LLASLPGPRQCRCSCRPKTCRRRRRCFTEGRCCPKTVLSSPSLFTVGPLLPQNRAAVVVHREGRAACVVGRLPRAAQHEQLPSAARTRMAQGTGTVHGALVLEKPPTPGPSPRPLLPKVPKSPVSFLIPQPHQVHSSPNLNPILRPITNILSHNIGGLRGRDRKGGG